MSSRAPIVIPDDVVTEAISLAGKENDAAPLKKLKLLLLQYPALVLKQGLPVGVKDKTTVLYTAARVNNKEAVQALIRRGADPSIQVENDSKSTAMHVACYRGNVESVKEMMNSKYQFDPNIENAYHEKCLSAFRQDVPSTARDTITQLVQNPPEYTPSTISSAAALELQPLWFSCTPLPSGGGWQQRPTPLPYTDQESINAAIAQKTYKSIQIGGSSVDISSFSSATSNSSSKAEINSEKTLLRYLCRWFFLNDTLHWSPCLQSVTELLNASVQNNFSPNEVKFTHDFNGKEEEYIYNVKELFSFNTVTKRKRPLLYVRDDRYAIAGKCQSSYYIQFDADPPGPMPYEGSERIEEAILNGSSSCETHLQQGRGGMNNLSVNLDTPISENVFSAKLSTKPNSPVRVIRFLPTSFFLNEQCLYQSYDPRWGRVMTLALSANHDLLRDDKKEYDLIYSVERTIADGNERPILLVQASASPQVSILPILQTKNPDIYKRFVSATAPRNALSLRGDITTSSPTQCSVEAVLALTNILSNDFGCVVKGGVIRDAVVRGEATFKDIDIELPRNVSFHSWKEWVANLHDTLCKTYGCQVDTNDPAMIQIRASVDILSLVQLDLGMITLKLVYPPIDLEMVPPWNIAYNPPRNVDFSVNNLRLQKSSSSPIDLMQSVSLNLPTLEIIAHILNKQTVPVYDVEWVEGIPPQTGEGVQGNKWVRVRADVPHFRKFAMDRRLQSMRKKGYKFIEPPAE